MLKGVIVGMERHRYGLILGIDEPVKRSCVSSFSSLFHIYTFYVSVYPLDNRNRRSLNNDTAPKIHFDNKDRFDLIILFRSSGEKKRKEKWS